MHTEAGGPDPGGPGTERADEGATGGPPGGDASGYGETPPAFPPPPLSFLDGDGRDVTVREYDGEFDALLSMYLAYDEDDRAQGLPPLTESRVREWLADLLAEGVDAVAYHDGTPVGHASLVPDGRGNHELVVFVAGTHQHAGIGTRLVEALLGLGATRGVEQVWLVVRRHNVVARNLYESVGFEPRDPDGVVGRREFEMYRRL